MQNVEYCVFEENFHPPSLAQGLFLTSYGSVPVSEEHKLRSRVSVKSVPHQIPCCHMSSDLYLHYITLYKKRHNNAREKVSSYEGWILIESNKNTVKSVEF